MGGREVKGEVCAWMCEGCGGVKVMDYSATNT